MTKLSKFKYPSEMEGDVPNFYKEIYEENEYNRFGIQIEKGDVVVDCGANIGIFSQYALDMGASKVVGYEPEDEAFEYYEKNVKSKKVDKIKSFISKDGIDVKRILSDNNLDKVDFLKLDIEGAEWGLFEVLDSDTLNKVDKWAIEFHTYYYNPNVGLEQRAKNLWQFLQILELFSTNGYTIKYEHLHKGWDIVHLYAKKEI
jgi:tRNA A58 N-methylase Trm61